MSVRGEVVKEGTPLQPRMLPVRAKKSIASRFRPQLWV